MRVEYVTVFQFACAILVVIGAPQTGIGIESYLPNNYANLQYGGGIHGQGAYPPPAAFPAGPPPLPPQYPYPYSYGGMGGISGGGRYETYHQATTQTSSAGILGTAGLMLFGFFSMMFMMFFFILMFGMVSGGGLFGGGGGSISNSDLLLASSIGDK